MTKIVDFDGAKDRRVNQEIERDEAEWNAFRDQLITAMKSASMAHPSLVSATLNALLQVLQDDSDLELAEAKDFVAGSLRLFGNRRF